MNSKTIVVKRSSVLTCVRFVFLDGGIAHDPNVIVDIEIEERATFAAGLQKHLSNFNPILR